MQTASTWNSDCLVSFMLTCFVGCGCLCVNPPSRLWILELTCVARRWTMKQRGEIREKYGIEGSGCGDCCTAFWCPCCAMVQNDKEVRMRSSGVDTSGYQPQGGMQV